MLVGKRVRLFSALALVLILTATMGTAFAAELPGGGNNSPKMVAFKTPPDTPYANNFVPSPNPDRVYFSDCGHFLSMGFLYFWRSNGKNEWLGCPISEELSENGRTVQYFQKARLEYHPENAGTQWETSLGLLGSELLIKASLDELDNPAYKPVPAFQSTNEKAYFELTGHSLGGGFYQFWKARGGLYYSGYPISEEYPQLIDSLWVSVQDFERTRLIYHPSFGVKMADLGAMIATNRNVKTAGVPADPKVISYSPDLWEHWVDVNLSDFSINFMEGDVPLRSSLVVSGMPGHETPTGTFKIFSRIPNEHMKGGSIGSVDYYDLYNVLYTQYFTAEGHALHYAWWRSYFGGQGSHGCINLSYDDSFYAWNFLKYGSRVNIHY